MGPRALGGFGGLWGFGMARTTAKLKSSRAPLPRIVLKELQKHKLALKKKAEAEWKKERKANKLRAAQAKRMAAEAKKQAQKQAKALL